MSSSMETVSMETDNRCVHSKDVIDQLEVQSGVIPLPEIVSEWLDDKNEMEECELVSPVEDFVKVQNVGNADCEIDGNNYEGSGNSNQAIMTHGLNGVVFVSKAEDGVLVHETTDSEDRNFTESNVTYLNRLNNESSGCRIESSIYGGSDIDIEVELAQGAEMLVDEVEMPQNELVVHSKMEKLCYDNNENICVDLEKETEMNGRLSNVEMEKELVVDEVLGGSGSIEVLSCDPLFEEDLNCEVNLEKKQLFNCRAIEEGRSVREDGSLVVVMQGNQGRQQEKWGDLEGEEKIVSDCDASKSKLDHSRGCKKLQLSKLKQKSDKEGRPDDILEEVKDYKCEICNRILSTKRGLRDHLKTHTGAHECDFCGKKFRCRSDLEKHRRVHTGDKPHCCDFCGKGFSQKWPLQFHRMIHTGERPFSCSFCDAKFRTRSLLTDHERTHGERAHQCDVCGKRFHKRYQLKKHTVSHNEKSHDCHVCGAKFSRPKSLREHFETHDKRYLCGKCGELYREQRDLTNHMKTVHKDVIGPDEFPSLILLNETDVKKGFETNLAMERGDANPRNVIADILTSEMPQQVCLLLPKQDEMKVM